MRGREFDSRQVQYDSEAGGLLMAQRRSPKVNPILRKGARCIGDGRKGAGCGYIGGWLCGGDVCPKCGGMILSAAGLKKAEELEKNLRAMGWKD